MFEALEEQPGGVGHCRRRSVSMRTVHVSEPLVAPSIDIESERSMTNIHDEVDFDSRLMSIASGGRDTEFDRHISSCASCRETLFALRQLVRFQKTTGGSFRAASAPLTARLSGMLSEVRPDLQVVREQSVGPLVERLRRVVGSLILDTGAMPQLVGVRSSSDQQTRQLAFVSSVADLDLEVTKGAGSFSVAGQLGMDTVPEGLRIQFIPSDQDPLCSNARGMIEAEIQQHGYFSIELPAADWVAMVAMDDALVLFPSVRL